MNAYETDEEKVEAIKGWWKENGISVVGGLALGLAAVFGWRAWVDHQEDMAQQASSAFEQLVATVETGNPEAARTQAALLLEKHGDSAYGALANLMLARVEMDAKHPRRPARPWNRPWPRPPIPVWPASPPCAWRGCSWPRVRWMPAATLIAQQDKGEAFKGDFAALRGDLAPAAGRPAEARAAYDQAIALGPPMRPCCNSKSKTCRPPLDRPRPCPHTPPRG